MRILLRVFKTLSSTERLIFISALLAFIVSFIFVFTNLLVQRTTLVPVAGGEYIEGIIGQPSLINPILVNNGGPDGDLTKLIFSDLIDLAESYKINEDGRIWNIRLKDNLLWHDNQPITSDDVIFTIKAIQDLDIRSPLFSMWQEVIAERVSEREIKLILPEPYAFFENAMKELKPLPKHIFGSIPSSNIRLSDYNLEPIGSGPFKFVSFQKERSGFITGYQLVRNEHYFKQKPYLEKFIFRFYQNEQEAIKAFNSGTIDGLGGLNLESLSEVKIIHQTFEIRMPRYYAIFFNPNSHPALKDKNVRLALNYAVDKKKLIQKIFNGKALSVDGPLIPGMDGYASDIYFQREFSLEQASQILEMAGWQLNNEGVREKIDKKESQRLEFNLIIPQIPILIETANLIQEDWLKIGVKLNLTIRPLNDVNEETIKTRNYEMIIFGNIFRDSKSPDLSSFWHSSERFYPGLNLALYENKTADALIESIRKNVNDKKRQRDLASLQSLIIQDSPAIFLFSPNYFYITKNYLKGFKEKFISLDSNRFENIENWAVKTARAFK